MIRLYGSSIGNGSFARVAAGMNAGLSELGQLAGFVPTDAFDEEAIYSGHDADTAVFVGHPGTIGMMTSIGWHKERLVLLPANSSWMPIELIEAIEKQATGFLAPSKWAAEVLRNYTKLPVSVWRHGVGPEFVPDSRCVPQMLDQYHRGEFLVLHMASTHLQRKGTKELLEAWRQAVDEKLLGENPKLWVVVEGGPSGPQDHGVYRLGRLNLPPLDMARLYRGFHVVCQPSRGEGFGMVPLEARACGVPVVMTDCTGHSEHARPHTSHVKTGAFSNIDDGPGAMAPDLMAESIKSALVGAYERLETLTILAQEEAPEIQKNWNWTAVTRQWLEGR